MSVDGTGLRKMKPDRVSFRAVLGRFCSGVVLVTGSDKGKPIGLTVQSFVALSLDPAMILLCVANSSTSWPRFRDTGRFCVHVLGEGQETIARRFAVSGVDKFEGVGWTWGASGNPVIDGCLAIIDCHTTHIYDEGDHQVVTADVTDLREGDSAGPLLFYRGQFRRLDPSLVATEPSDAC